MDAFAVVIVILAVLGLLAVLAFAAIRSRRDAPIVHTHAPNVPGYTHDPRHMEYYRPKIGHSNPPQPTLSGAAKPRDPRMEPLPRCPGCGVATGYDDERCHKCGLSLKD